MQRIEGGTSLAHIMDPGKKKRFTHDISKHDINMAKKDFDILSQYEKEIAEIDKNYLDTDPDTYYTEKELVARFGIPIKHLRDILDGAGISMRKKQKKAGETKDTYKLYEPTEDQDEDEE